MKTLGAAMLTSLALLPVRWQPGVTATNDPKTETVVEASGNLRVPGNYRTAYQSGNPRGSEVVMPPAEGSRPGNNSRYVSFSWWRGRALLRSMAGCVEDLIE